MRALKISLAIIYLSFQSGLEASNPSVWQTFMYGEKVTSFEENANYYFIGTRGGLVQVPKAGDGQVQYLNKSNSMLPSNMVEAVRIDNAGRIWVGTYDAGIAIISDNEWDIINTFNSKLDDNSVMAIELDNSGNPWIGTSSGMLKMTGNELQQIQNINWGILQMKIHPHDEDIWYISQHTVTQFRDNISIDHSTEVDAYDIHSLAIDKKGHVWVVANSQVSRFNGNDWQSWDKFNTNIPGNAVFGAVAIDTHGDAYIFRGNKKLYWDGYAWISETIQIPGYNLAQVTAAFYNENNHLILTDKLNLYILENGSWKTELISNSPLTTNYSKLLTTNKEGDVYVKEFNGLVHRYSKNNGWESLPGHQLLSATSYNGMVSGQSGNLYFGTGTAGLVVYNKDGWQQFGTLNSSIASDQIWCIDADEMGNIWMGTPDAGLIQYDGNTFLNYNSANSIIPDDKITAINTSVDGVVWFNSGNYHLVKFKNAEFTVYDMRDYWGSNTLIWTLLAIEGESVWIGSSNQNLGIFDGSTFEEISSPHELTKITALALDKKGNLWAGSYTKGLFKYNENEIIYYDYENSPLPSNRIFSLALTPEGALWGTAFNLYHNTTYGGVFSLQEDLTAGLLSPGQTTPASTVRYYPNPAKDYLDISFELDKTKKVKIAIINITGQKIREENLGSMYPGTANFRLDLNNLKSGIYYLQLDTGGNITTNKVVLSR